MPVPYTPGEAAPRGGMCKGQRGDRGGPATPGKGGPTGPRDFGRGKGPGGARAAPHPGGLTRIVQPRESSRECRGEGGSPGGGLLGVGRWGQAMHSAGQWPPPHWGEDGGSPQLEGGPRSMGAPAQSWHPRGVWWRDIQVPNPPFAHLGMTRWARARWGVVGAPHPLVQIGRGEFPPLHN